MLIPLLNIKSLEALKVESKRAYELAMALRIAAEFAIKRKLCNGSVDIKILASELRKSLGDLNNIADEFCMEKVFPANPSNVQDEIMVLSVLLYDVYRLSNMETPDMLTVVDEIGEVREAIQDFGDHMSIPLPDVRLPDQELFQEATQLVRSALLDFIDDLYRQKTKKKRRRNGKR